VFTNPAGGQTVLAGTTANSSVAGNVTGGNILTGGIVSATGNITGNFFIGNGSALTGIDATSIQSGTSNVRVVSSGGNVATGIGGTSNVVVVASTGAFVTGLVSATGNITGSYIFGNGALLTGVITSVANINLGTSNVTVLSSGGNVLVGVGGANIVRFTGSGIENAQANATGNIGNSTGYFNTIFAQATSAQYADLAEMYAADAAYAPGTVVSFGGANEVTQSGKDADRAVAGVVSTNPSYIMNAGQAGDNVVAVALTGRVPTSVTGSVAKGDLMVSNGDGTARAETDPRVGTVIGKALENFTGATGTIEVVVGRF